MCPRNWDAQEERPFETGQRRGLWAEVEAHVDRNSGQVRAPRGRGMCMVSAAVVSPILCDRSCVCRGQNQRDHALLCNPRQMLLMFVYIYVFMFV